MPYLHTFCRGSISENYPAKCAEKEMPCNHSLSSAKLWVPKLIFRIICKYIRPPMLIPNYTSHLFSLYYDFGL